MIRVFAILVLVSLASLRAASEQPPEGMALQYEYMNPSDLPKGIHVYNPEEGEPPTNKIGVAAVDLDLDGRKDFLINVGGGGTGGSYFFVFHAEGSRYRELLQFMGGPSLLPPVNGFSQIQVWSRASGGVENRTVYSYKKDKYIPILNESYRRLDDDVMELLPK